jgi:DNA-binding LacI/PurR family transcriptional regulator
MGKTATNSIIDAIKNKSEASAGNIRMPVSLMIRNSIKTIQKERKRK